MTGTWISIDEAMQIANRSKPTIYLWIKQARVRARRNERGVMEVHGKDLLETEATVVRGRPKSSARPTGYPPTRRTW